MCFFAGTYEDFESAGTSASAIAVYGLKDISISQNTITNNPASSSEDTTGGYTELFGVVADGIDDSTNDGLGIQLRQRAKAKAFNNLIYFTSAPFSDEHYDIRVVAHTATPVLIYHNTMNNVSGCFEVREMNRLKSNWNLFVNAAGPMRFNDTDEGNDGHNRMAVS